MESRNRGSELLNGPAAHICINRRLKDMRTDRGGRIPDLCDMAVREE